jgi:hypothetical protein
MLNVPASVYGEPMSSRFPTLEQLSLANITI